THSGLARFSALAGPGQLARSQPRYYLPGKNIFRLFQERNGDLWISEQHAPGRHLTILNPQTRQVSRFPSASGEPDLANDRIQAYSQDRSRAVWFGLERGGLWRRSAAGFRHYGSDEGAPESINWIHTDSKNRIWVASNIGGVSRIDDPESD